MLDRLEEVDERYAYYDGSLIFESSEGDTLFPSFGGKWTILEEVDSREDAIKAAEAWKEAAG